MSDDAQVLVVGMGPTGVALAGLLGRRGVRTAVFDRLAGLYPLPRAAGLDHEVMRVAQELGVAARLAPYVVPYRASQYRGVRGDVIKRLDSPPPPHRLGWEPMYAFDQPAFETILRAGVGALPTVTVSLETEVTAVGQGDGGVWADVLRPGHDGPERVRGDYLVACDGGGSPVRGALGITMSDLGFHENWLVVDAIVTDDAALARLPDTQVQYCEPGRPATFVNLVGRHRRWEIALDPGELPVGPVPDDAVWPWLERWVKPGEARIWRAAAYLFHGLVADRWRRRRVLLAGDAAHMTPPFMAQGMAQGMRDAQNLAWKLHAVLGGADERLLDTYETERRPHVVTTTGHTIALGRVICERDEAAALARDADLRRGHTGEVPVTIRSSFLPALDDGLLAARTPGAGEILPQPFVAGRAGHVRLDDVTGTGFRVVVTPDVGPDDCRMLTAAVAPLGGRVVRVHPPGGTPRPGTGVTDLAERDGVMTAWLRGLRRTIAVARPDHYVYGTAASARDALDLLAELVARCSPTNADAARPGPSREETP